MSRTREKRQAPQTAIDPDAGDNALARLLRGAAEATADVLVRGWLTALLERGEPAESPGARPRR